MYQSNQARDQKEIPSLLPAVGEAPRPAFPVPKTLAAALSPSQPSSCEQFPRVLQRARRRSLTISIPIAFITLSSYNHCNFGKSSIKVDSSINRLLGSRLTWPIPHHKHHSDGYAQLQSSNRVVLWFTSSVLMTFSFWVTRRGSS